MGKFTLLIDGTLCRVEVPSTLPTIQKAVRASDGRRSCTGLSSSGSNQAREGRLVDALAVRGDEGRDTLR